MRKLRKYKVEKEFLNVKDSLEYPSVSYTKDSEKVWVKEEENYILVTYKNKINNDDDLEYIFDDENYCYVSNWFYIGDPIENEKITPSFIEREELIKINEDNSATYKLHLKDYAKSDGVNFKGVFSFLVGCGGAMCVPILSLDFSKAKIKILDEEMEFTFSIPYIKEIIFGNNFDTSNVTNMYYMFYHCENLISLDLSSFNTSNVTSMSYMFSDCSKLTSLDLSNFDTSKVTNMGSMFNECRNLTSITFGNKANVSNVTLYGSMFDNTPSNLVFNYDCNYDYSILLNYNSTYFKGYTNCLTKEQTWLVKLYDYTNNNELITDSSLNLTLSNGIQGIYDSEQSGYTFTFTNIKDISRYDVLMNGEVIGQIRCNKFNYGFVINLSGNYIKETVNVYSTTSTYELINDLYASYTSYMSEMYIDGVKQNNIVSSYTFNEIGEHEVIYVFDSAKTLTSCSSMFYHCNNLTSLDLSSFDTSNVTTMELMFNYCDSLTSLDLSSFDTSNVIDMYGMFYECYNLTSVTFSDNFDTSNVTSMGDMFGSCYNLTSLDLRNFNTSKVTDIGGMFGGCSNLTSLDLSNFDTSKVTDMRYMFSNCYKLTSIDFGDNFNTSNVTDMGGMFSSCYGLTSLNLNHFDTSNVTDMEYMFCDCSGLTSLDLSNFDTSNVTDIEGMFSGCSGLTTLDLSSFDTSKVTSYSYMFYNLSSNGTLTYPCAYSDAWNKLLVTYSGSTKFSSSWTATCQSSEVTNKIKFIENGVELSEGNFTVNNVQCTYNLEEQLWEVTHIAEQQVYSVIRDGVEIGSVDNSKKINYVLIGNNNSSYGGFSVVETILASSTSTSYDLINSSFTQYIDYMFIDGEQVSISSEKTFSSVGEHTVQMIMNTSKVTNMRNMFSSCYELKSIKFGDAFITSNVTTMYRMFYNCNGLTSLDLSNFDTSNVTSMIEMFNYCDNLTSLDLSNWNTSNLTNMNNMFSYCESLTSIVFGNNFDTSNVTTMYYMFYECSGLTSLDLSSFDTSKVTDMGWMFYNCTRLKLINFGDKANVSKVTSYTYMFRDLPSNGTLIYPCAYSDAWDKLLVTYSGYTHLPSSWTKECK